LRDFHPYTLLDILANRHLDFDRLDLAIRKSREKGQHVIHIRDAILKPLGDGLVVGAQHGRASRRLDGVPSSAAESACTSMVTFADEMVTPEGKSREKSTDSKGRPAGVVGSNFCISDSFGCE
jgi:hypothetical protein